MAAPVMKVELGFLEKTDPRRLKSKYFPSKCGGKPSWLHLKELPRETEVQCSTCGRPLTFLLQIYAPIAERDDCFHRTIFLFFCEEPGCCRPNEAGNFVAFRCQLPRKNEFYGYEPPEEEEGDDDVDDRTNPSASDFVRLCVVCGSRGSKKCALCCTNYCSKEHQIRDWKEGHKETCKNSSSSRSGDDNKRHERIPEYDIVTEPEPQVDHCRNNDCNEEAEKRNEKECVEESLESKDLKDLEEMSASRNDKQFSKFRKRIALEPDQVIRYERSGIPLWVSSKSIPSDPNVPKCDSCGATRQFEFQVLPQLLNHLKLDDVNWSVDWGTIVVYTCSQNCNSETKPYLKEFVYKQDFTQGN